MAELNRKVDLFLDSGAFSAWTQGTSINIDEYIQFIKDNQDIIEIYANLDVIGLGGNRPNRLTAEKTLENQKYMEKAGLHPLPCFHMGEPMEFLDYYVENYDYLALGVAGQSGNQLTVWLNDCFLNHICDKEGKPKIKIHGFAVTSLTIMLKYPWWSVDSTSWVVTGRMGSIFVPRYKGGKWVYDERSWKIAISSRSPGTKEAGKHLSTMTPMEKQIVLNYIHEKGYVIGKSEFKIMDKSYKPAENERWLKKDPKLDKEGKRELEVILEDGLCNRYQLRDEMNIIYFLDLEKNSKPWPWPFEREGVQNGFL